MRYSRRWALAEKTELIMERYNKGAKLSDLAREFQVADTTVRQILVDAGVKIRKPGNNRRRHALNENFFEHIDSEEKAYWVGFLLADGCVLDGKSGLILAITLSHKDRIHLEKLRKSLSSTYRIVDRVRVCRSNKHKECQLQIRSKKLCKDLIKLNVTPRKTYTGTPATVPKYLRRHYFRGLIDGDGSIIVVHNSLGYSLRLFGTKAILVDFSRWLGLRGKHVHKRKNQSGYIFSLSHQQKVVDGLELLYDGATIYLDRKYERYQDAIKRWYAVTNKIPVPDPIIGDFKWIPQPKQLRLHF